MVNRRLWRDPIM